MRISMLDFFRWVFVVLSGVLIVVGIGLSYSVEAVLFANIFFFAALLIGGVLMTSQKKLVANLGYALFGSAVLLRFTYIVLVLVNKGRFTEDLILTLVGCVFYLIAIVLLHIKIFAMKDNQGSVDKKIETMKEWKQLLDQGVIDEELFLAKRNEVLNIKPKNTK